MLGSAFFLSADPTINPPMPDYQDTRVEVEDDSTPQQAPEGGVINLLANLVGLPQAQYVPKFHPTFETFMNLFESIGFGHFNVENLEKELEEKIVEKLTKIPLTETDEEMITVAIDIGNLLKPHWPFAEMIVSFLGKFQRTNEERKMKHESIMNALKGIKEDLEEIKQCAKKQKTETRVFEST